LVEKAGRHAPVAGKIHNDTMYVSDGRTMYISFALQYNLYESPAHLTSGLLSEHLGVPRRQSHRRSGPAALPSVGAVP